MTARARLAVAFALILLLALACAARDPEAELHRAARMGKPEKVKELLEQGYDVNKVIDGATPAQTAAASGRAEALDVLLEAGADAEVQDENGRDLWRLAYPNPDAPFLTAAEADTLAVLVRHGFADRMDLLEAGLKADRRILIESLVEAGADLQARDEFGWTPLHLAAWKGREDSTAALLEAGADVNAQSTATFKKARYWEDGSEGTPEFDYPPGTRPLDVASSSAGRGHKSCAQLIREHGGEKSSQD